MDINIENITTNKDANGATEKLMTLSIKDVDILKKIKNKLSKIDGITSLEFKRSVNE